MRLGAGDAAGRTDPSCTNRGADLMVASAGIDDRGIGPRSGRAGLRIRHAFEPTRLSGSVLAQAYQRAIPVARYELGGWTPCGARRERRRLA